MTYRYLTKHQIIQINRSVISAAKKVSLGIQYPQGLDTVVEQPKQVLFGKELYPTIWLKAAFIIQKITKKHIFADGNKRTALITGLTFLRLNNHDVSFSEDEKVNLMVSLTNSPDSENVMLNLALKLEQHKI